MTNKKPSELIISENLEEKLATKRKSLSLHPSFLATTVIDSFKKSVQGDVLDLNCAIETLVDATAKIKKGDLSEIEAMLFNQAKALEQIFTSSIRTAKAQENLLQFQTHFNFALKAQNQSRATLQALIQLKQPNQTSFIKQANIAHGHQQVNNPLENNPIPQNELLEENQIVSPKMDARATIKAK